MAPYTFPDLPGWTFAVREVSMSVFEVVGQSPDGRSVRRVGSYDEATVLEAARAAATDLEPRRIPPH